MRLMHTHFVLLDRDISPPSSPTLAMEGSGETIACERLPALPLTPGPSPQTGSDWKVNTKLNSLAPLGGEGGQRPGEGAVRGTPGTSLHLQDHSGVPPALAATESTFVTVGTSLLLLILLILAAITQVHGQDSLPAPLRSVGIDQRLNEPIPFDLEFRNEDGKLVGLGDYFGKRPVILALVYHECPMLCNELLNGLVSCLRTLSFTVGKEFDIITVSFNPREDATLAKSVKQGYLKRYSRAEAAAGWHFLTGDQTSIERLTRAVGFRYTYDSQRNQYAHASAIMVVTPQGRLSRYFYGVEFAPRDLRLGLVEASQNKIGSLTDQVLLFCFHYDPAQGKYGLIIMNLIRLIGGLFAAGLGAFIVVMLRRDRRVRMEERGSRMAKRRIEN